MPNEPETAEAVETVETVEPVPDDDAAELDMAGEILGERLLYATRLPADELDKYGEQLVALLKLAGSKVPKAIAAALPGLVGAVAEAAAVQRAQLNATCELIVALGGLTRVAAAASLLPHTEGEDTDRLVAVLGQLSGLNVGSSEGGTDGRE